MNFKKFWDENDIWKHDPYISDDLNGIEEKCAEYGWDSCKKEILKILDNKMYYEPIEDIIKKIENL